MSAADALATGLYQQYGASLQRYAGWVVGDADRSADLVQEALLRAWLNADRLSNDQSAQRRWLFRVVHNIAIDELRSRHARFTDVGLDESTAPTVGDEADRVLSSVVVQQALRWVQPRDRKLLVEIYLRGRSLQELADELGIPLGTVKSRLHYALRLLRRRLGALDSPGLAA